MMTVYPRMPEGIPSINQSFTRLEEVVDISFKTTNINFTIRKVREEVEVLGVVLLQTDTSEMFVVLPKHEFLEKINEAMEKLYKLHNGDLQHGKKQIVAMLRDCDFEKEAKAVSNKTGVRTRMEVSCGKCGYLYGWSFTRMSRGRRLSPLLSEAVQLASPDEF